MLSQISMLEKIFSQKRLDQSVQKWHHSEIVENLSLNAV